MRRLLLLAFASSLTVAFTAAGLWQLDRGRKKEVLLDAHAEALTAPLQPLAAALASDSVLPQRVDGRVRLLDAPWLLLDNQRRGPAVGVRAYRAATVPGREQIVLVEFGWLPLSPQRQWPPLPALSGELDVAGLLAAPPSVGLRMAQNALDGDPQTPRLLLYLDPAELSDWLGRPVAGRVLRLDPALPIGFERDLDTLPNTLPPERHLGYALQWFSLAAAVVVVSLLLMFRNRRR